MPPTPSKLKSVLEQQQLQALLGHVVVHDNLMNRVAWLKFVNSLTVWILCRFHLVTPSSRMGVGAVQIVTRSKKSWKLYHRLGGRDAFV